MCKGFGLCPAFDLYFSDASDAHQDIQFVRLRHRRQATSSGETSTLASTTLFPTSNDGSTSFSSTTTVQKSLISETSYRYYNSRVYKTPVLLDALWEELGETNIVSPLSDSYTTANTVYPPFNYTFYGQKVGSITITSGGFLYTSDLIHKWLSATNYIAPLMANFDTRLGGDRSVILYQAFDSRLVVEYKDVFLREQNETSDEPFHFQCILHQNGTIVFLYKKIPIHMSEISARDHPMKIGLSDAYYIDSNITGTTRRTIYEYSKIEIDKSVIDDGVVVILTPLPTCNTATDCETCLTMTTDFTCKWCSAVRRCSGGLDRYRDVWLKADCVGTATSETCAKSTTSSTYTTERSTEALYENETTLGQPSNSTLTSSPISVTTSYTDVLANGTTFSQGLKSLITSSVSVETSTTKQSSSEVSISTTENTTELPFDNTTTSPKRTESTASYLASNASTETNLSATAHSTTNSEASTSSLTASQSTIIQTTSADATLSKLLSTSKSTTPKVSDSDSTISQSDASTKTQPASQNTTTPANRISSTTVFNTYGPISKGHRTLSMLFNVFISSSILFARLILNSDLM